MVVKSYRSVILIIGFIVQIMVGTALLFLFVILLKDKGMIFVWDEYTDTLIKMG